MEHSSILGAPMASIDPADPLTPAHGGPGEDEAQKKYSGFLVDNEYGTTLRLCNRTEALANEQSFYWEKTANYVMLDSPNNERGAVRRNSLATASSLHTSLSQQQSMMQFTDFSRTPERWHSGVLIDEGDASAQEGGIGQTGAHASCMASLSHRLRLKGQSGTISPADSSNPERRRHENQAEEFFRLADERKTQRFRLRAQQQHQLAQQREKQCCRVAEPHTHSHGRIFTVAFATSDTVVAPACETGSVRAHHDRDEDAATALNSSSMQLLVPASRSSLTLCSVTLRHQEAPLPKSMVPRLCHRMQQQQPSSPPRMDGGDFCPPPQWEPLSAVPTMRGWAGEALDVSRPLSQHHKAAYSSERGGSESGSYTGSESVPGEQREWMGVCPARDFPYVRSPDWAALNAMECASSKSPCSEQSASEEADEGDQTPLFWEVDRSGVLAHVPPPLAAASALPMTGDVLDSHRGTMKAAASAAPLYQSPVSVTAPTNRPAQVPQWGAPPLVAAAPLNRGVGKRLIARTTSRSVSASFAPSSCSSSVHSSGSSTSSSRSLSTPKRRPDVGAAGPFSRQPGTAPLRVHGGGTAMRGVASSDGRPSSGVQGHTERLTTATLVVLPRKAAKQRFFDRFSAFKRMLHKKALL
ncbi:hypothetical protein GH5_01442 [Leishmania sp. Ghana 2012 LV757]|uniref:hypothetical protein n=1 Tax=Leishmania sp. Ghana 2012 LV757 TaxID=2803181 RepID=UPI001B5C2DD8|nr:hypothetical protein GH5_01442 [Leishmania sp. Ghana 2012 LV757]